jgi:hypothetical protein
MQKHFLFVETPREAVTWNAEKKLEPNLWEIFCERMNRTELYQNCLDW